MKIFLRRLLKLIMLGVILITGVLLISNFWVEKQSKGSTYDEVSDIPYNKTGLVLGTSKWSRGGGQNLYFKYRMEAVKKLYDAGKIKYIIISGDNSLIEYNETKFMKESLRKMGIPDSVLIEDYAGFSTLDSVLRAKKVFGQDSLTIISQEFHNERAIFIAKNHDIYAIGFNAQNVPEGYGKLTQTREYFARVKALIDIYILNRMPKFYKEKEIFPDE